MSDIVANRTTAADAATNHPGRVGLAPDRGERAEGSDRSSKRPFKAFTSQQKWRINTGRTATSSDINPMKGGKRP